MASEAYFEAGQSWSSYTVGISALIVFLASYNFYVNQLTYFQRRNLKGPRPIPIFGNLHSLLFGDRHKLERDWPQKYGLVYGVFHGSKPRFIISDPEIMRQLCVKDFAYMPDHQSSKLHNEYQKNFIVFVQGESWKRLRSIQSPTFTSGKIKRMYKLLDRCADDLVLNFSEHLDDGHTKVSEAKVNLKEIYSLYTMDGITTAAYNIKLDRRINSGAKSVRGDFVEVASRIFKFSVFRTLVAMSIPVRLLQLIGFEMVPRRHFVDLDRRLRPILDQRRHSAKKADDYLQILVDARMDDEMELNEMDEMENHHAALTQDGLKNDQKNLAREAQKSLTSGSSRGSSGGEVSKGKLTDEEIIANAVHLLAVGLDTTAILLTNSSYALAFHPEIQQRTYEQVKSIARENLATGEYSFDYDDLTSCEYLDAVISETLRILSPVLIVDRSVKEDYYIEKYNVWLKKDERVFMAFYSIMNNPEFWPDPLKFDPERFMGENKKKIVPGSYCPFGLGPRHCLGMRFSLTEAKLALAKVLMRFEFTPAPGTKFPPKFNPGIGLQTIKNPVVNLTPRVSPALD